MVEVVLDVDVEERGHVAERHGGAVLLLDGGEVGHVDPLYGFLRRRGGTAQVEAVVFAQHFDVFQGFDLFSHLFAQADALVSHRAEQGFQVGRLGLDDAVYAVERQTPVVADDAAAGIVVGQTRQEAQRAELAYLFGVNVEHTVVMRLAVVCEDILHLGVHLHTVFAAGFLHHLDAAERLDGALQELVCLKTYDELVFAVDVAGFMRSDRRDHVGIERTDAAVVAFLLQGFQTEVPDVLGALRGALQERGVALIRGDVRRDEVRHIDFFTPKSVFESVCQFHKSGLFVDYQSFSAAKIVFSFQFCTQRGKKFTVKLFPTARFPFPGAEPASGGAASLLSGRRPAAASRHVPPRRAGPLFLRGKGARMAFFPYICTIPTEKRKPTTYEILHTHPRV